MLFSVKIPPQDHGLQLRELVEIYGYAEKTRKNEMYSLGARSVHTCDGSSPDVGRSVGLGNGSMLYVGERPEHKGWSVCIYQMDGPTIQIAEGITPMDDDALAFLDLVAEAIAQGAAEGDQS